MVLIQTQIQMQPSCLHLLYLLIHPLKMKGSHPTVPTSLKVEVSLQVILRIPKDMNRVKEFQNLRSREARREGGTDMAITPHLLKIIIPRITREHILTQGTTVKLIQETTQGPERKLMKLMVRVQV
uniref:Uncharacterized protein n=1 Tax=Arundo donax TaxID=35708 RepID=A0A0A9G9Q2_ARUDO